MRNIVKKILIIMLVISLLYVNGAITINAITNSFISYAIGSLENEINNSKAQENQDEIEKETKVDIEREEICKTDMKEQKYQFAEKTKIDLIKIKSKIINISDISNTFYKGENPAEEEINIIYKTTKLNKQELLEVLGTSGTIQIKDKENGTVLLNIGSEALKTIETVKEGQIISTVKNKEQEEKTIANIKAYTNEIEIEYLEPVKNIETTIAYKDSYLKEKEETLNITSTKEIEIIENSTLEQITKLNTKMLYEEKETEEAEQAKKQINVNVDTNVKERASKAEIAINKPELSTTLENDVQFTITLFTESKMYDLFKNPTLKIELPECVETINTINKEDITLLNNKIVKQLENGEQQEEDIFTNIFVNQKKENNKNYIEISMQGEQKEYTESAINNVQIVIPAKIKTSILLPTTETLLNLYYTNQNKNTYTQESLTFEGNGENSKAIKFVAATGIITKTTVDVLGTTVENYKGEKKSLVLPSKQGNTGTVKVVAVNNLGKDINNAKILGNSSILGQIKLENAIIKYSTEENASVDSNTWTENYIEGAKSYLIQINSMKQGQTIEYTYNITMPKVEQNTTYEQTYAILDGDNQELIAQTTPIELKTVKLDVELTSSAGEKPVYVGQELTYTITVKNIGETTAEKINITDTLPEQVSLLNEEDPLIWSDITLEPEESIVKRIKVKVNENEALTSIQNKVEVSAEYLEENIIKTITNEVKTSDIEAKLTSYIEKDSGTIDEIEIGAIIRYGIDLVNKGAEQQNLTIVADLPKNIDEKNISGEVLIEDLEEGGWYPEESEININGNKITMQVNLPANGEKYVSISAIVDEYIGREVKATFSITYGAEEIILEDVQTQKTPANITIETATYKGETKVETEKIELTPEEELTYEIKLKNTGETTGNIEISGTVNSPLVVKTIKSISSDNETTEWEEVSNNFTSSIFLSENETFTLKVVVGLREELTETTELTSEFEIRGNDMETQTIIMKNIVEIDVVDPDPDNPDPDNPDPDNPDPDNPDPDNPDPDNPDPDNPDPDNPDPDNPDPDNPDPDNPDPDNPDPDNPNPDNPDPDEPVVEHYQISGLAWLDKNENGAREENEEYIKGITVQLLGINDQTLKETKTDKNGKYTFTELEKGEYIILFEYNKNEYKITTTKQTGVADNLNSDAIESTIEGETITRTDTLLLTSNLTNIDIGLVERGTFDLKIQKQISKITVNNSEGTKTIQYNNANIAKIEIPAKSYIGTNLIIEYNITIKNEGTVAGYVYSIKDVIPKGTEFLSELNTDWYEDNGNLYSISLTQEKIQPGETKTLKVLLTKQIETDTAETITNTAEINQTFNEELLEEENIKNNTSEAQTIITVKTGQAATYVIIAIIVLAILGSGIYLIKKKVLS